MFARLGAKLLLVAAGAGLVFFGIGLIGFALAGALTRLLGPVGSEAVAGAVLLVPPLLWVLIVLARRPPPPPQTSAGDLARLLLAALAKKTPWAAVAGAGLAAVADLFLKRNKPRK